MKKIFALLAVLLIGLSFSQIMASSEPANKNLLNPEHFETDINANTVTSTMPISVTEGETYTFSMPSQLGDVHVLIHSEAKREAYVNESKDNEALCEIDWFVRSCTFKANADVLDFEFQGGDVAQHVAVYDFDGFQLEEGTVATDYVEYQTIENTPPVFGGESTLILGYDAPVSAQTLVDNHITATDEIDGDISDAIIIAKDEYGPNNQVKGTYPIDLYVEDSSGNEATYTLNVKVVDTLAPIIDSVDALSVNVNNPTTVDAIIGEHATLSDEYDGVIDAYTITSDTYTGNETVLGTSNLTFEIADASGNTKEHSITITTEDSEAPQINGKDTQTINQSSMKTLEELFAQYSVSDNHTASEAIAFEIASDTFPSEGESGEYTMTLKATDESGNETLKTVTILIEDDIEPTLRSHSYKKESYKDTFDIETYISKMTVDDNDSILSTNDVVVLENEYQSGTVGKYEILFEVSDDAGNDTSHKLTVDVVDDVAPVFAFSETIQTTTTTVLNETQLNQLIVESEDMETFDAHNYRVLNNTYTDNAAKEGTYTYTVEYMNQKGDTVTSSIDIEVLKINAPEEASNTSYLPWLLLPGTVITVATLTIIKKRK